ncbi:MAG: flap endonuclease-1 [Candidatus Diapherotrites archaeon]|nr:flap endonuclease-1 [Candidatus Diapherotrites archaeon]
MGVALGDIVEKEEISLESLNGKMIGFDAYNIIYQFLASIRGYDGTPLMDSEGRVTSHLSGIFYRTINIIEKGIKPVFVFDGKPKELKMKTLTERTKIRTEAIVKHEEALKEGDLEEARKVGSKALKVNEEMIKDAKELIDLMGLPCVQAPSDGEAQLSYMNARGDIYGCASQDYDCLLFGAPVLLRNVAIVGKRKVAGRSYYVEIKPERVELKKVLSSLGIDRKKLIWIGILIGTDFNDKFPNIGPKKALDLVKKYNSFDDITKNVKNAPTFDYHEVEDIFMNPDHCDDYLLDFRKPDKEGILSFLCDKHDFSKDRVEGYIDKLEKNLSEKGGQSSISRWF